MNADKQKQDDIDALVLAVRQMSPLNVKGCNKTNDIFRSKLTTNIYTGNHVFQNIVFRR